MLYNQNQKENLDRYHCLQIKQLSIVIGNYPDGHRCQNMRPNGQSFRNPRILMPGNGADNVEERFTKVVFEATIPTLEISVLGFMSGNNGWDFIRDKEPIERLSFRAPDFTVCLARRKWSSR